MNRPHSMIGLTATDPVGVVSEVKAPSKTISADEDLLKESIRSGVTAGRRIVAGVEIAVYTKL